MSLLRVRTGVSYALLLGVHAACGGEPRAAEGSAVASEPSSAQKADAPTSSSPRADTAGARAPASTAGASQGNMTGRVAAGSGGASVGGTASNASGGGAGASATGSAGASSTGAAGTTGASSAASGSSAAGAAGGGGSPQTAACDPADKTADPKPASFKLLGGYDTLSMPPTTGPLMPVIEVHAGFPDWTVYRPEPIDAEKTHEIMIWGNGGCLLNSTIQGQFLLELASWGFVVVADGNPQDNNSGADPAAGGIRSGPDGAPMVMAMDWITAENDRPCSPFYQKLDVTKIGTGGQSCGGMMTLLSAGDKRVTTAMVFNSGLSSTDATLFASYHAPMLFLAGGSSDFLSSSATANVNAISSVPIFYGNLQVGHGGTWESENGGEMGRVAVGWMKWKLQGDAMAEKLFVGADCELCKPPSMWTIVKKMID